MDKLQKGLIGIVLPGLFAVSGCGSLRIGGYEPVNLSKSRYARDIEEKADELAKTDNIKNKKEAIKAYGSLGLLEKMDMYIKELVGKKLDDGMSYAQIGDKYHKMHKK